MAEWRIERFDRGHVREGFDCGKPSLNDFLLSLVGQYEKRDLGRTYVALDEGDPRVLGYYTLTSGAIGAGACLRNKPRNSLGTPCRSFCSRGWRLTEVRMEKAWADSYFTMH